MSSALPIARLRLYSPEQAVDDSTHDDGPTVAHVIDWYTTHYSRDLAASTWRRRQPILAEFRQDFGHRAVVGLLGVELANWCRDHPRWQSANTHATVVIALKACFGHAARDGQCTVNPFGGVRVPHGEPGRALSEAEYEIALRFAGVDFVAVIKFLRFTGCRTCELRAMRWSEVNLDAGLVVMHRHKTSGRTRRARRIVLSPEAVALVREQVGRSAEWVWVNRAGGPWTKDALENRWKAIRRRAAAAGCPLARGATLYSLRHTFGTDLAKRASIKTLSILMGHASTQVTERYYVHLEDDLGYLRAALATVCE